MKLFRAWIALAALLMVGAAGAATYPNPIFNSLTSLVAPAGGDSSNSVPNTSFLSANVLRFDRAQSLSTASSNQALANLNLGSPPANTVFAAPNGASGIPSFRLLVPADSAAPADGCVRIAITAAQQISIKPYTCNTLWIGASAFTVTPSTLNFTSPPASTVFYVYAMQTGGVVTGFYSTSGHVTNNSDLREYLNNGGGAANTNFRLIGMCHTNSGNNLDLCINWFYRGNKVIRNTYSTLTTASTTTVPLTAAVGLLSWNDEAVSFTYTGSMSDDTANVAVYANIQFDGTNITQTQSQLNAANLYSSIGLNDGFFVSEGYHTTNIGGSVSSTSNGNYKNVVQVIGSRG